MGGDPEDMMEGKNAPYYRMWQERWEPFTTGEFLAVAMHFSPQYFEKLRRELEAAGYEVTEVARELEAAGFEDEFVMTWTGVLYSPPLGHFLVSDCLKGECFVFLDVDGLWMKT
jgi:hypothetical protein